MIRDMILPQLGMGMSEGKPVNWFVQEGARIERDQPLVEIETEKVVTELPAPHSGFLHIVAPLNETIPIETCIAQIADTQEEYQSLLNAGGSAAATSAGAASSAAVEVADDDVAGADGPRASGLARRLAKEHAIPLDSIQGTGPKGRIVREDVLAAIERPRGAAPSAGNSAKPGAELIRIPLVGARKTIAERTARSKVTAAHTYGYFEIDVTDLVAARRAIPDPGPEAGGRISLLSFLARALALACRHVPICNATLVENELVISKSVNIGVVVSLPGTGEFDSTLATPVLRDAQDKDLATIDRDIKALARKARDGRLTLDDMQDGTITLSSTANFFPGLWALGTPLLFLPQVFAFQPGNAIEKPVVRDGQITVRTMLPCGISFDHRAMDGEPVGRFVTKLAELLGAPDALMA